MRLSARFLPALACLAGIACAADRTQDIQVRLLNPIASYSRPGTPFKAKVIGPVFERLETVLPRESLIHGRIVRGRGIGLGLRHERASLEIEFTGCESSLGEVLRCRLELLSVDNARESVLPGNRIRGILPASHPHSWLSGVWYRPGALLAPKGSLGLTGAGGFLQARLAPTPVGAVAVVGARMALFRLTNPDIELPAGAELVLRVSRPEEDCDPPYAAPPSLYHSSLAATLHDLPAHVSKPTGGAVADILNLAFLGPRETVEQAFTAAGWILAEPLTPITFARTYAAFTSMRGYPSAPVSNLLYDARPPDFVFQRALNSLAKRHHSRFWSLPSTPNLWLAAATHDTSISFNPATMGLTHKIDPEIDRERAKILNDLTEAGCVQSLDRVERPSLASTSRSNPSRVTDGALLLVSLRDCSPQPGQSELLKRPRRPVLLLVTRRFILETRHYLTRGNTYYWGLKLFMWHKPARKQVRHP